MVKYGWFLVLFEVAQAVTRTGSPASLALVPPLNVWIFVFCTLRPVGRGGRDFIYFAF